jgi:hypothetical protein
LPTIHFDNNNLFIKRFRKKNLIVPLEKTLHLECHPKSTIPTPILKYSLQYKNETGDIKQIRFLYHNHLLMFKFEKRLKKLQRLIDYIKTKNSGFTQNI